MRNGGRLVTCADHPAARVSTVVDVQKLAEIRCDIPEDQGVLFDPPHRLRSGYPLSAVTYVPPYRACAVLHSFQRGDQSSVTPSRETTTVIIKSL